MEPTAETTALTEAMLRQLSREQLLQLDDHSIRRLAEYCRKRMNDDIDAKCAEDPLYWAQNHTKTSNPHYREMNVPFHAPLPRKDYFRPVFDAFARWNRLLIAKSREMLTSWCGVIWATNRAQWHQALVVIQCQKEDKVAELIGYAECLYSQQPEWLRARHPLKSQSSTELACPSHGYSNV